MAETDISIAAVIVRAELAEFRKSMATMGPEAAAAAADMTKAIQKELKAIEAAQRASMKAVADEHKKAASEATKAAKTAGRSWNEIAKSMQFNQTISDMEQVGAMFILVGGSVSKMAMLFTSAVRPVAMLGTILGPNAGLVAALLAIPAAALGAVAAVGAINSAVIEFGNSAVKIKDDVKGLVPKDVSDELEIMAADLAALDNQSKILTATMAYELAPQIRETVDLMMGWREVIDDIMTKTASMSDTGRSVWDRLPRVVQAAISPTSLLADAFSALGERAREVQQGKLGPVIEAAKKIKDANTDTTKSYSTLGRELSLARGRFSELEAAAKAAAKATDEIGNVIAESATDLAVGPMGEIEAAYNRRVEKIYEAGAAEEEVAMAEEAINARRLRDINSYLEKSSKARQEANKEAITDAQSFASEVDRIIQQMTDKTEAFMVERREAIQQMWLDFADQMLGSFNQIASNLQSWAERKSDTLQSANEEDREAIQQLRDDYDAVMENSAALSSAQIEQIQEERDKKIEALRAEIDGREEAMAKAKDNAMLAYALSQSFAMGQAVIQGAVAIIGMAAQMAPYLGPAAPEVAAGLGAALIAAQIGAIASQPPPEFPMGRTPDHVKTASLRDDEGVANPRAMREIGGPEALDRLNKGQGMASGGGMSDKLLAEIRDLLRPPRGPSVLRLSVRRG